MADSAFSFVFSPGAVLRAVGPDALTFLQGQVTQELRNLKDGGATYGLWLNHKGKVMGDSHLLRIGAEEWLLVAESFPASALRERLEHFLIADDVVLTDETAQWHLAVDLAATLPVLTWAAGAGGILSFRTQGTLACGLRLAPIASAEATPQSSGGAEAAYRIARIEAGLPAIPMEFGEADLPQEAGLEERAISFTKGCYLGQEVMARLHAMGQVRRQLRRVAWHPADSASETAPAPRAEIMDAAGKRIGELRGGTVTVRSWIGFAMLQRQALENPGLWSCAGGGIELL